MPLTGTEAQCVATAKVVKSLRPVDRDSLRECVLAVATIHDFRDGPILSWLVMEAGRWNRAESVPDQSGRIWTAQTRMQLGDLTLPCGRWWAVAEALLTRFVSREEARRLLVDKLDKEAHCACCSDREYVGRFDRWRNYEAEMELKERLGGLWVVAEPCPFNGEWHRYAVAWNQNYGEG